MIRALLLSSALAASASAQQFDYAASAIVPEFNINLNAQIAELDFTLQLRVPNTPEAIRNQPFFTEDGRKIHFRMLADPLRGYIIGTPVEGLELELLQIVDGSDTPRFVVIGRQNSALYDLSEDDLFVTDLRFGDYCLELEKAETAKLPLSVSLAVDVSGSMDHALPDVRQSLADFVASLPPRAMCEVVLFNHEIHHLVSPGSDIESLLSTEPVQPQQCSGFADQAFLESAMKTGGGGTDIMSPLRFLYERSLTRPDELNLILVISDGAGRASRRSREFRDLVALRDQSIEMSGTYTIVNWLGHFSQKYPLADLADYSLPGPVGGQAYAQDFFASSRALLEAQRILTPVACE